MLVMSPEGGIVNDPVLLHVEQNVWWMQLADSDAGLYAIGVLSQLDLDAEVSYPDVHPVQVQGPLSAKTLEKLVGPAIYDIKYYWCERFTIGDIPVVISRTGWSAVPGFEVNLLDGTRGDALWQAIMDASCTIRRVRVSRVPWRSTSSKAKLSKYSMSSGSVRASVETRPGKSSSWLRRAASLMAMCSRSVPATSTRRRPVHSPTR